MRRFLTALLALPWLLGAAGRATAETIYAVIEGNTLVSFDSATPGVLTSATAITGLPSSDAILNIDLRPATGQLYGIGLSNVYAIDIATGAATLAVWTSNRGGPQLGFDFNPATDRLRTLVLIGSGFFDRNLLMDVDAGQVVEDRDVSAFRYAAGDPNAGRAARFSGLAYTNNFASTASTALYGIDLFNRVLAVQSPAEGGPLTTVGSLTGTNLFAGFAAFDISGVSGVGYAMAPLITTPGGGSEFYTIDLSTGAATLVGRIGDGRVSVRGIAAPVGAPIPEPATPVLLGAGLAGVVAAACGRRRVRRGREAA